MRRRIMLRLNYRPQVLTMMLIGDRIGWWAPCRAALRRAGRKLGESTGRAYGGYRAWQDLTNYAIATYNPAQEVYV